MPVTKNDLNTIAQSYFIATLTQPKHPVTPDVCGQFAYNCYSIILTIPSDKNAYVNLLNYMGSAADYYGIDPNQANEYLKKVPGIRNVFFQYIKDNYRIETNAEILQRLIKDGFEYVGDTLAGGLWALIKPFIPLILLGFGIFYVAGHINKRK